MTQISKLPNLNQASQSKKLYDNPNVPKAYKDIAVGMERQFIGHLINEMEKSVKSSEPQGPGTKYYKSLLSDERSKIMANVENGIGLKDIILDQIVPAHLKAEPNKLQAVKMYQENRKVQGEN